MALRWVPRSAAAACGLLLLAVGCGTQSIQQRSEDTAQSLKQHGIEVEDGKMMRVFRF